MRNVGSPSREKQTTTMIEVEAHGHSVRVTISMEGMSADEGHDFVRWLRIEGIARRSRLADAEACQMAEEIKAE